MEICERTVEQAWKNALKYILSSKDTYHEEKNNRTCIEVLNLQITITEPSMDISKPIEILNSFQKWVYPNLSEISSLVFSKIVNPVYDYNYGPALFNYGNMLNQIDDYVIPSLKKNPSSRRAIATLWNPSSDSKITNRQVPGLVFIDFKLRKNKLHTTTLVRSNDIFFGWPANIYQVFILQKYICEKLNCKPGPMSTFSTSAHIFDDQIEYIKKVSDM